MKSLPQIIDELRDTRSHLEKIKILQTYKTILTMPLYYAYSPFLRYHIRNIPKELRGRGQRAINMEFYALLTKITNRDMTGDEAKKNLFLKIERMTDKQAEVAKGIVKKNLSIGCNASLINKAYGKNLIETHRVMLAQRFEREPEFPCLVSPKIDGVRAVYHNGDFYSRAGHKLVGLDHLKTTIIFKGVKEILDGELFVPNRPFDELSGIIRSYAKDKPDVKYAVFDTIQDGVLEDRLMYLEDNFPALGQGFDVEHVEHVVVRDMNQVDLAYRRYRSAGFEGCVVKNPQALYQRKRSWDWQKIKPTYKKEYKITGVFEGEGKFESMLGGIYINIADKTVGVGTGFSDQERVALWKNPPIGRWATVEAMEKTALGSLRHPVYHSIRWDIDL